MAEKGFGVKEINLIGASGTPTIESPNNLNLNAVNVAISTNVSIGGTLSVTGNVSVGGTLTYEDVTNIDSVGVITARDHVVVGGGLSVVGISTLSDIVKIMSGLELQTSGTLDLLTSTSSSGIDIQSNSSVQIGQKGFPNQNYATFSSSGVDLYYSGSTKLATTNTGATVTGTLAATAVTGDGSGLTNLPAATPTTSDIQVAYELLNTSSSSNGYRISGNGTNSSTNNPDLYLIRGQKYRFINNSGGSHPFRIQSDSNSTLYSTGVTNNNASSGNIDFAPTYDSPAHLYYKCGNHPSMLGNIYLRGANGGNQNVGVTTITGANGNLLNVNHTDGGGAQGVIRTKASQANSSSFIRAEDSGNTYIGLLKYGTGHSAYGALGAGDGALYANSGGGNDVNITLMADSATGHINFATGGNTERLKIAASGTITTPYQFHIECQRSGNQTGYDARATGSNAGVPMVFNDVVLTRGTTNSALNTSTGKVTVPVDGVYFLEASAYTTSGNALSQGWFTIGSSRMTYSDITQHQNTDQIQCHGMHYLSANDEVGFHPYGATASSITIEANIFHTWFRVTLMG